MSALDSYTDPLVSAVSDLLRRGLIAQLGEHVVRDVVQWPAGDADMAGLLSNDRTMLVVARSVDVSIDSATTVADDDQEAVTLTLAYYAPITGNDRIEVRWPLLRVVWRTCKRLLRAGAHPGVDDNAQKLEPLCIVTGEPFQARVQYAKAQTDSGIVPMFRASVTLRVDGQFDWEWPDEDGDPQVTYDGLDRVVIEADHVSADHPEGDPDRAAFESDNDLTD